MDDLVYLSASELLERLLQGSLSAAEVLEAHIQHIEAINPQLNAVVLPRFDQARAEAEEADRQRSRGEPLGPLHGLPVTIKDQFHVTGLPTTFGVDRLREQVADGDGAMVAALLKGCAKCLQSSYKWLLMQLFWSILGCKGPG